MHDPVTVLSHLNSNTVKLKSYYCVVNTTNPDVEGTNYGTIDLYEPSENIKANILFFISPLLPLNSIIFSKIYSLLFLFPFN